MTPQVGDDRPNILADAHANAQGEGPLLCIAQCSSLPPMGNPSEIDGLAAVMQLAFTITSRETGHMQVHTQLSARTILSIRMGVPARLASSMPIRRYIFATDMCPDLPRQRDWRRPPEPTMTKF
jgi:hypothetical protein